MKTFPAYENDSIRNKLFPPKLEFCYRACEFKISSSENLLALVIDWT